MTNPTVPSIRFNLDTLSQVSKLIVPKPTPNKGTEGILIVTLGGNFVASVILESSPDEVAWTTVATLTVVGTTFYYADNTLKYRLRVSAYTSGTVTGEVWNSDMFVQSDNDHVIDKLARSAVADMLPHPTISGVVAQGNTLTVLLNQFISTVAYQWQKDGVNIAGATLSTHLVSTSEAGHTITCNLSSLLLKANVGF